tara:strand:+ start:388 stop:543 length:156 start_codon:yes stop_codon:yes gene_type:complete
MKLNKKIISQIWDSCEKQIIEGYVYVKMDDIIKLDVNNKINKKIKKKSNEE